MHGTRIKSCGYSSLLSLLSLPTASTVSTAFSPVLVTNMEVAKTDTSFLVSFLILETPIRIMLFLMIDEVLDLEDVFLVFLDNIGVSICYDYDHPSGYLNIKNLLSPSFSFLSSSGG